MLTETAQPLALPDKPSIAVLRPRTCQAIPSRNTADAIVEHIITALSRFKSLFRLFRRALELDPRFGCVAALAGVCHMLNVVLGYAKIPVRPQGRVRLARLALTSMIVIRKG